MIPSPPFKEASPELADKGWKTTQPSDGRLRGDWWTLFEDAPLNSFEQQVDNANPTLQSAEANFRAARAQLGYARSYEAPTIGTSVSAGSVRESANQPYPAASTTNGVGDLQLSVDFNYEIDLWGRIRRGVAQSRAQAQEAAADLENARLSLHAELALDYFNLRSADAQEALIDKTILCYGMALKLTSDRYRGGAAPQSDVVQARTVLAQALVRRTEVEVQRSRDEHAIAILIGEPPASFTLPVAPLAIRQAQLPNIPGVLPTTLLERRPDIASQERRMAAANERIGIAQAAYYPTLNLGVSGGFLGTSGSNWLTWPSRFWAVGPTLAETLFDGGRRRASKQQTTALYDQTVADYRQAVLTAFRQVEDNLAELRILETEARQQQDATLSASQSVQLFQTRYEGGVDTYLQVVIWETAALNDEINDIEILRRRLDANVLLIKALGGGWDTSHLPQL
jgi:NodT family efflux transporter outer membrane factor (OMF) lipoprotein